MPEEDKKDLDWGTWSGQVVCRILSKEGTSGDQLCMFITTLPPLGRHNSWLHTRQGGRNHADGIIRTSDTLRLVLFSTRGLPIWSPSAPIGSARSRCYDFCLTTEFEPRSLALGSVLSTARRLSPTMSS